MVSLQTALSPQTRTAGSSSGAFATPPPVFSDSCKKRKRDAGGGFVGEAAEFVIASPGSSNGASRDAAGGGSTFLELLIRAKSRRPATEADNGDKEETSRVPQQLLDVELHLGDRPMQHHRQRCLNVQTGRNQFLNSRTQTLASKDQCRSPPSPPKSIVLDPPAPAGIDLELNLSCDQSSSASSQTGDLNADQYSATSKNKNKNKNTTASTTNKSATTGTSAPTVSEAAAPESSHEEMVAAVCARCHMLIMMRRTSPSCPNCKFLHPPPSDQQPLHGTGGRTLVRPTAGFGHLLCCKD